MVKKVHPMKPRRKAPPVFTLVPQRDGFLLDGQPFQIRSGEMHFARIPRPYWRHRRQMARAITEGIQGYKKLIER